MTTRERNRNERERTRAPGDGAAGGSGETEEQERTERLVEAGDRAIRAALSSDSTRFLAQVRQEGGQ